MRVGRGGGKGGGGGGGGRVLLGVECDRYLCLI